MVEIINLFAESLKILNFDMYIGIIDILEIKFSNGSYTRLMGYNEVIKFIQKNGNEKKWKV